MFYIQTHQKNETRLAFDNRINLFLYLRFYDYSAQSLIKSHAML